jgi:uncharacterized membrane-anchored protein YjiN (DUF445 family)
MVEQKSQKISTSDRADEEHGAANGYDEEGLELRAKMPRSDSMPMMPDPSAMDWSAAGVREMLRPYMNKGSISNCATFSIMLVGMLLKAATAGTECGAARTFGQECARWILAAGLFGFAGGITNWVAIKMLFDRVCNLPGSGVIPRRFKEIRQVIKDTIMKTFFDGPYLEAYMNKKMASLATELNLGPKLKELLETPEVDEMVTKALEELGNKPEGTMIMMMGIMPIQLKPLIIPMVSSMADDIAPLLGKMFDAKSILSVDKLRTEIDTLMTEKLLELTPERVRDLLEEVIRTHLGWLVVWGNVFGALIGLVSTMAGYP